MAFFAIAHCIISILLVCDTSFAVRYFLKLFISLMKLMNYIQKKNLLKKSVKKQKIIFSLN